MSGPDKLCNYFNQPWLEFTGRPIELELQETVGRRGSIRKIWSGAWILTQRLSMAANLSRWTIGCGVMTENIAGCSTQVFQDSTGTILLLAT